MAQSHDEDHLKILSVFHYVVGGLGFLFSLFPTIHLVLGILMVTGVLDDGSQDEVIHTMGWLVAGIAATLITLGFTYSTCLVLAGRYLAARTQ